MGTCLLFLLLSLLVGLGIVGTDDRTKVQDMGTTIQTVFFFSSHPFLGWSRRRLSVVVLLCYDRSNEQQLRLLLLQDKGPQQFPLLELNTTQNRVDSIKYDSTHTQILVFLHICGNFHRHKTQTTNLLTQTLTIPTNPLNQILISILKPRLNPQTVLSIWGASQNGPTGPHCAGRIRIHGCTNVHTHSHTSWTSPHKSNNQNMWEEFIWFLARSSQQRITFLSQFVPLIFINVPSFAFSHVCKWIAGCCRKIYMQWSLLFMYFFI